MERKPRVLVIGASGQIGGACMEALRDQFELIGTYNTHPKATLIKLDFTNEKEVRELIGKTKPFSVILCAALTNVDYCEIHPDEAQRMNHLAVQYVADACITNAARLVYLSTDYVFDGKAGPYKEDAKTGPISVYGRTKLDGEKEALKVLGCLIIRTGNVFDYGYDDRNFVVRLIGNLRQGKEAKAQTDLYATPTLASHIARAIGRLLDLGKSGTYNVAGKETISRYDLSMQVAKFFNLPEGLIVGVKASDLGTAAKRPLFGGLVCEKLLKETGIEPLPLLDALKIIKAKMEN
ncbi:MAG: SDR family oxidoreductase [Candidatus Micrarchaeota archaeon]